ncbi:MAG: hypothetical protein RLZ83_1450, partial [Pseudomonadota bacterium]
EPQTMPHPNTQRVTSNRAGPRSRRTAVLIAAGLGLGLLGSHLPLQAAGWPEGPVQLVVPAKAGGGTDAAARIFAGALQKAVGRPVVVANQPAGGGTVAAETVRNAKPDGRTILFFHTGLLASHHTGQYAHAPRDAFGMAVVMPVAGSYALTVGADSPYKTAADLVAAAKAQPDKITLGVQLKGSTHFMAGLWMHDSKAPLRVVEAGGDADKLVAVQGGTIQSALINTPGALQYVKAGKLRILATISGDPGRDPGLPDVPSLAEAGYPSAVYGIDFLILAPKATPAATLQAINAAFGQVLADPAISAQFTKMRMPLRHLELAAGQSRVNAVDAKVAATARQLGFK